MRNILLFCFLCSIIFPLNSVILHFQVGTTDLTDTSQQDLVVFKSEFEAFFKQNPETLIFITGHTDDSGTDKLNKQLSLSRADLIKDHLINDLNVSPEFIKIFGKGSKEPIDSNETESGRYLNRRVEIVFEKPEAEVKWLQNIVEYIPSKSGEILTAEPEVELFRYDKINTEDRSRSGIEFSDRNLLILEENSLMIIYGDISSSFSNLLDDKFHVELKYGGLYNKLENMKENSINVRTPAADLELYSSLNSVEFNENRTLTSIYEGYGLVMAQGNSVKVNEGFGIEVALGEEPGEPVKLPATPVDLSISSRLPTLTGEKVSLQWTGSAAEYLIQLSTNADFHELLDGISTSTNTTQLNLHYGEYFLRIQARDKIGLTSPFSRILSLQILEKEFLICNELTRDETVVSVEPEFNYSCIVLDQIRVFHQDKPITISEDNTFSGTFPLQFGANSLIFKTVLPDGDEKFYTYPIQFNPEVDKTVSFLNLQKGTQNLEQKSRFTIEAEASEHTRLFINGNEFSAGTPGAFYKDIDLERGSNILTIQALFIDGSTGEYEFDVVYDKADSMTTLEIIAAISTVLLTSIPLIINAAK